ncbi:sugar transferase [Patescibacteria group bacterium]|nr:sugar transferase [Patescibacteria group bacterium]
MKKSELFFSFLLVPIDFLMIVASGLSAYYIRFADYVTEIRPVIFDLDLIWYLKILFVVATTWIVIFALAGLYNIKEGTRKLSAEIYRVILSCSTGFMMITVVIFMGRELFDSRFIALVAFSLSIIYISVARTLIRYLQKVLFRYEIGVHQVVLLGAGQTAENLIQNFSKNKRSGYKVVKRLYDFSLETSNGLLEFIKKNEVDEIIQADPNLSKAEVLRLYDFADENHITFKYCADLLGTKVLKTDVVEVAGVPIVEVKNTPLDGWGRIVKRIFDIIASSLIIIALSPMLIVTAILVKLDSHGPVFFSRKDDGTFVYRVGQGGKLFSYFKFRSMIPGTDNMRYNELASQNLRDGGPMVKIKNDPRVTRVGKFIRRWSIDELPELFLVLKGDMSLVGPRPHLPEEVAKYERHHKKVLTIKPGITGMAQISGRSDLNFEDEVKLDAFYIENWSLWMDLAILLRTPLAVFRHRETE